MRRWLALLVVAIPAAVVALLWTSPPSQAQPIPQSGLRVVTHGSAMSGSGTVAAPLDLRADCDTDDVLAWDGDSWECSASGGSCSDIGSVCSVNTDCCSGYCDGSFVCAIGAPVAGTNIDVSGSTVSVEPTVDLAGAANENTLEVTQPGGNDIDAVYAGILVTTSGTSAREPPYSLDNPVWGIRILADSYSWDDDFAHVNGGLYIEAPTNTPPHVQTGQAIRVASGDVIFSEDLEVTGTITSAGGLDIGSNTTITGTLDTTGALTTTGITSTSINNSGHTTLGTNSGDTLTVNATTTHAAPITVGQVIGTVQETTSTGTVNDFAINDDTTVLAFNNASALTISGFTGGVDGRCIDWVNIGGSTVSFTHDTGSTSSNRNYLSGTVSWTNQANERGSFCYSGTSARWHHGYTRTMASLTVTGSASFTTTVSLGTSDDDVSNIRLPKDSSSAPTYSSCGTSPAHVAGGSWAFSVTVGTGTITACTATFANSKSATPVCQARVNNATEDVYVSSVSATAVTVTARSGTTDLSGDTISVFCFGDA